MHIVLYSRLFVLFQRCNFIQLKQYVAIVILPATTGYATFTLSSLIGLRALVCQVKPRLRLPSGEWVMNSFHMSPIEAVKLIEPVRCIVDGSFIRY